MWWRGIVGALVAACFALAAVPSAQAGTYTVWSCSDSTGHTAPTEGWSNAGSSNLAGGVAGAGNGCVTAVAGVRSGATGRATGVVPTGLTTVFSGAASMNYLAPSYVRWDYTAPAGTTITTVTLNRSTSSQGYLPADVSAAPRAYLYRDVGFTGLEPYVDGCFAVFNPGDSCAQSGTVSFAGGGTSFGFGSGCEPRGTVAGFVGCIGDPAGRARYAVTRAAVTLDDPSPPTASQFTGSAMDTAPITGTATLGFHVADEGSGVLFALVKVDGKVVWSSIDGAAPTPGGCELASRTDGYLHQVPCPLTRAPAAQFDTTTLDDGGHELTVETGDASLNWVTVLKRVIMVGNHLPTPTVPPAVPATSTSTPSTGATASPRAGDPAGTHLVPDSRPAGSANGTGGDAATAQFVGPKSTRTMSAAYGSPLKISGRLLDARHRPVVGATIDVLETLSTAGAVLTEVGPVTTDATGRFTYALSPMQERTIVLAYAARVGSAEYRDRRTVAVQVHALVDLTESTSSAGRGDRVVFSGKVVAGALPAGGVRVVIEAFQAGRWRLAAVPRTGAGGAFSWSHRFRIADHYRMRARVLATVGLAVRAGSSRAISLMIRQ